MRALFLGGAKANREAACRRGALDRIEAPGMLVATGDIHDNPIHFHKVVRAAGMDGPARDVASAAADSVTLSLPPSHLTLHEIIHSDRLINGMDFSYRALARVAALKMAFPERVHTLLANHELAQVVGAGIVKDGVRVVEAFNMGLEYIFGEDAGAVAEAACTFVKSMPLALRCVCPGREFLCAHSLPSTAMMGRFDPSVLDRELRDEDYEPRHGAAHIMVWGRGYDAEQLEDLAERWGVSMFVLGHEKAENGVLFIPPCAVILNSDHDRGVYLPIDLERPPRAEEAAGMVVGLAD